MSSKSETKAPLNAGATKIKILVVDDHPIIREGLMRMLEREADLTVCGQAENTLQALRQIESSQPDLAIVDVSLAREDGIELINEIKVRHPELLLLVLSMHEESVYAERVLRAGAKGYVMKQEPPQTLLQAIRQVLLGEIYLKPGIAKQIVRRLASGQRTREASPFPTLSQREFEVFALIARGFVTRQIAKTLNISDTTVQSHRERIKRKLGLKGRASLIHFAFQWTASQGRAGVSVEGSQ